MVHVRFGSRSSVRRALLQAFIASLIPLGTAFAQNAPLVRVTGDDAAILTWQSMKDDVLMTAPVGTVLEVIYTEGDKYSYQESNWYWVLLPRDSWGTQRAGWISGSDVEQLPPAPPKASAPAELVFNMVQRQRRETAVQPVEAGVPAVAEIVPETYEVVLNFNFAKSDLTPEARGRLAGAIAMLKGKEQGLTIALEGHADAIGTEPFNEKLGLARAETVKRQLAEQHGIPIDKISVVTFGENQPMAPNDTPEGRAQNRRVVVKVVN